MYTLEAAVLPEIFELLPVMRDQDREDIEDGEGKTPEEVMTHLLGISEGSWCLRYDGVIVGLLGVFFDPTDARIARPWAIFSRIAVDHKMAICRRTKSLIEEYMRQRPIFITLVDKRNDIGVEWIKWLGFEDMCPHKHGPNQREYRIFAKWDEDKCHLQQ